MLSWERLLVYRPNKLILKLVFVSSNTYNVSWQKVCSSGTTGECVVTQFKWHTRENYVYFFLVQYMDIFYYMIFFCSIVPLGRAELIPSIWSTPPSLLHGQMRKICKTFWLCKTTLYIFYPLYFLRRPFCLPCDTVLSSCLFFLSCSCVFFCRTLLHPPNFGILILRSKQPLQTNDGFFPPMSCFFLIFYWDMISWFE